MPFNSLAFIVFFPAVFVLYWLSGGKRRTLQNLLLLAANAVFYARWDFRFLALLYGAALIDYALGLGMAAAESKRRRAALFGISLGVNLGLLVLFKYFGFFASSFADLAALFGLHAEPATLKLILPLGISFFTFQRLSYTIDLYRRQIPPARDLLAFLAFSSFFPLILAGPIERAKRLLPQFEAERRFDPPAASDALRQILAGLFKKMVVADNLAPLVNAAWANYAAQSGIDLAVTVFFFAIQIYADFSGYSDMAVGVSRLLGFRVMRNFANPYFSRDIGEFWRRWHISMSSWFRDYIYTPLSMKVPLSDRPRRLRNVLISFTASGLWHGSNWTFVFWGALNGLYFTPLIYGKPPEWNPRITAEGHLLPSLREAAGMAITFLLTLLAWVFFRSESLAQAFGYLGRMVSSEWLSIPQSFVPLLCAAGFMLIEWFQRSRAHLLDVKPWPLPVRWSLYCAVLLGILIFGNFGSSDFIYVQF